MISNKYVCVAIQTSHAFLTVFDKAFWTFLILRMWAQNSEQCEINFEAPSQNCEKPLVASTFLSIRPSACKDSAPTGQIFHGIWYQHVSKPIEKIQVSLKSDKNNRVLYMKTDRHLWLHLAHFFLEWEMLNTRVVEKIETHIWCAISIFENRAVYEKMWKYIVQPDGLQMTTWRAHAHTHTHTRYQVRKKQT